MKYTVSPVLPILLLLLSACDNAGPESCEGDPLTTEVGAGEFAVQVRRDGECKFWKGDYAHFTSIERSPFRHAPHFFAELSVSTEGGPRLYFAQYGETIKEKSHEVANLADAELHALTTIGEKAGIGGQRLLGRRALSKSGTITVEASEENTVTASFEATLTPYNASGNIPGEEISVSGRFKAERDSDQTWVIF